LIILFCVIGVYSINNSVFEINVMIAFGAIGYIFRKAGYESAPIVLAFLLGPIMENALRQSLIMADGSLLIFLKRPLSAVFLITAALLMVTSAIPFMRKRRDLVGQEGSKNA
jgi:putative tricarboxylic transport membrane protein